MNQLIRTLNHHRERCFKDMLLCALFALMPHLSPPLPSFPFPVFFFFLRVDFSMHAILVYTSVAIARADVHSDEVCVPFFSFPFVAHSIECWVFNCTKYIHLIFTKNYAWFLLIFCVCCFLFTLSSNAASRSSRATARDDLSAAALSVLDLLRKAAAAAAVAVRGFWRWGTTRRVTVGFMPTRRLKISSLP